jgi:hypothetical protein
LLSGVMTMPFGKASSFVISRLAARLGAEPVFLLGDNGMPADARKVARNLGLEVVGAAGWDAEAQGFAPLARRIARSRPDAVAILGVFERNEGP